MKKPRPTREELVAAANKTVPELLLPRLKVLFCGINPGLYTAAIGHNFGRPGNRFWPALFAGGFSPRLFDPSEEAELLPLGFGITNVVSRATAAADELTDDEVRAGGKRVRAKVKKLAPRFLAVLGLGAYRIAFEKPKAIIGLQDETLGETKVWVLPNPSGLNAHYQPDALARIFRELHDAVFPPEQT